MHTVSQYLFNCMFLLCTGFIMKNDVRYFTSIFGFPKTSWWSRNTRLKQEKVITLSGHQFTVNIALY